jgi:outer membrane lipoprotein-sorting protein
MNGKRTGLIGAGVGVLAGGVGLAMLAMPAGAGPAPVLPQISAEQLVRSVLTTKSMPALAGTVTSTNNLGLPTTSLPGVNLGSSSKFLTSGSSNLQVWTDGKGKGRVSIPDVSSGETLVYDGTTLWDWTSSNKTVVKSSPSAEVPGKAGAKHAPEGPNSGEIATDPSAAAKQIIALISKDSTVKVDGATTVAGRSAYELVLAPKPAERTLLREVRIAVDSETKIPLQLSVLANGSAQPALRVGFSKLNLGPQDPSLFTFTPPAGAKATTENPKGDKVAETADKGQTQVVGGGWDSVVVGQPNFGPPSAGQSGTEGINPTKLLGRLGKRVSGSWGSGYEISTSVATVLVTDDGRVAAGTVPMRVLTDALASAK